MLKPTIGLEIHIEAKTNSKMFCSCKNDPEEKEPNKNIFFGWITSRSLSFIASISLSRIKTLLLKESLS